VRQSLMMSQGDLTILVARPLSAVMLAAAALILVSPLVGAIRRRRVAAVAQG
jgi:putative tricarboxylic transport membrane protein